MAARNVLRLIVEALTGGEEIDLAVGQVAKFVPEVNDQGSVEIGNATKDVDVKVFLGGDGSYVLFDSGAKALTLSGVALNSGSGAIALAGATTLTGKLTPSGSGYVAGKAKVTVSTTTKAVTAADFDALIELANASATTVTLPAPAASNAGARVKIVSLTNADHVVNTVNTIVTVGDITASTLTANSANSAGQAVVLESDATKWVVLSTTGDWAVA